MTPEEIKELIYNSPLNYENLNISDGRLKGYITVLIDKESLTAEEIGDLTTLKYFYLDSFEIDINKYYTESLKLTKLNENQLIEYSDVEFQFKKLENRKEVA